MGVNWVGRPYKSPQEGLSRVGVEAEDLYMSINDNCSTARKTGLLLPNGAKCSCDMHLADLMTGLALSLVTRQVNGRVVNKWHPS